MVSLMKRSQLPSLSMPKKPTFLGTPLIMLNTVGSLIETVLSLSHYSECFGPAPPVISPLDLTFRSLPSFPRHFVSQQAPLWYLIGRFFPFIRVNLLENLLNQPPYWAAVTKDIFCIGNFLPLIAQFESPYITSLAKISQVFLLFVMLIKDNTASLQQLMWYVHLKKYQI